MAIIDFPSSPTMGQEYIFGDFVYVWDGVKWTTKVIVGGAGGGGSQTFVSETPPDNAEPGSTWFCTANGLTYILYSDEDDTIQWVESNPNYPVATGLFSPSDIGAVDKTGDTMSGNLTVPSILLSDVQGTEANAVTRKDYVDGIAPTRKKSEVHYTGFTTTILSNNPLNLVHLLNGFTPTSGSWEPMFDTVAGKLTPFNDDRTVNFKLNLIGSFGGSGTNRGIQLDFNGTVGNRVVVMRDSSISPTSSSLQFATFFSVDKNGNMALNGTEPIITVLGGSFTLTEALIIAEQETTEG